MSAINHLNTRLSLSQSVAKLLAAPLVKTFFQCGLSFFVAERVAVAVILCSHLNNSGSVAFLRRHEESMLSASCAP
jgi:hypothetical protein